MAQSDSKTRPVDLTLHKRVSAVVRLMNEAGAAHAYADEEILRIAAVALRGGDRRLQNRRDGLSLGHTPDRRADDRREGVIDGDNYPSVRREERNKISHLLD